MAAPLGERGGGARGRLPARDDFEDLELLAVLDDFGDRDRRARAHDDDAVGAHALRAQDLLDRGARAADGTTRPARLGNPVPGAGDVPPSNGWAFAWRSPRGGPRPLPPLFEKPLRCRPRDLIAQGLHDGFRPSKGHEREHARQDASAVVGNERMGVARPSRVYRRTLCRIRGLLSYGPLYSLTPYFGDHPKRREL